MMSEKQVWSLRRVVRTGQQAFGTLFFGNFAGWFAVVLFLLLRPATVGTFELVVLCAFCLALSAWLAFDVVLFDRYPTAALLSLALLLAAVVAVVAVGMAIAPDWASFVATIVIVAFSCWRLSAVEGWTRQWTSARW